MALEETTLASACAIDAKQIVLTSGTGVAIGDEVRVDGEIFQVTKGYVVGATIVPVLRGQGGTVATAHSILARVVHGTPTEFVQNNAPQTVAQYPVAGRARIVYSYGADGAIALPQPGNDALVLLSGTVALAMTLAVPTKDMDGTILSIACVATGAHVITVAGGISGSASLGTATFEASPAKCILVLMALDEKWALYPGPVSGTLTSLDIALSS